MKNTTVRECVVVCFECVLCEEHGCQGMGICKCVLSMCCIKT